MHLRLVNVGAATLVRGNNLGYPVCLVCGQSRSPFSSQPEIESFQTDHGDRCGKKPSNVGFFSDIVAETLIIQDCDNREVAYSIAETLRQAASNVLDMDIDDLQVLALGQAGREQVDMILYDPMPGGSALLELMRVKWVDIIAAALHIVGNCSSKCDRACVDCLLTFRNAHYHRHLNRHVALETLQKWGDVPRLLNTLNVASGECKYTDFDIFIMKNEISPIWEDPENRNGSICSIKIDSLEKISNIFKIALLEKEIAWVQ
jgi:hypothetical protein